MLLTRGYLRTDTIGDYEEHQAGDGEPTDGGHVRFVV